MRTGGVEPPPLAGQDPKSCASASSATLASRWKLIVPPEPGIRRAPAGVSYLVSTAPPGGHLPDPEGSGAASRDAAAGAGPRLVGLARETSLRERLVARDEQALVELVDLASPWLLGVTQAMLQDRDEAEEVVMETFRTVWQNVTPVGEGPTGLMPYLLRVARHRAIDRLRSRRRRARLLTAAALDADRDSAPPVEPDEAGRPGWQVHTKVHAALDALPADQRTAVELAYFGGLTHSEIAARLGIPLGTVKTRLRLAFSRLRTSLAGLKDWVV